MTLSKRATKRLMEQWRKVPIGTPVIVHREHGRPLHTNTRTHPYLLGDGVPAILVVDMATHVPLQRIELAT